MGILGPIRNPVGIDGFTNVYKAMMYIISPVLTGAAALAVLLRLRRAIGVERQQIKWFTYAAAATFVATTLAIAALFNPLRHRIQSFIDRRFYRSKYDARRTLETFSTTLRDETDLDTLSGTLVGVVRETMQPAYALLWLRPGSAPRQSEGSD